MAEYPGRTTPSVNSLPEAGIARQSEERSDSLRQIRCAGLDPRDVVG